jgi:protein tyrosine phosphatase (PTP) superfamily phosphohydrolase (DUF442 family)
VREILLVLCLLVVAASDGLENSVPIQSKPAIEEPNVAAAESPISRPEAADFSHLHLQNVIRVADTIYSGGQPQGDEAFADLARLGAKVVVSVDGMRPDVDAARQQGLRYVHIPIGYAGIPEQAGLALARIARETAAKGDALYIHCHHGKHRGPAAAAIACIATGAADSASALRILEQAGTGQEYAGLWRDVATFRSPPADATLPALVEVAEVDSLVTAMTEIDRAFDALKLCQAAGWATPADHPDLVAAQEALLVQEALHEAARIPAKDRDERFVPWLAAAERLAEQLQQQLRSGDRGGATHTMVGLERSCTECHVRYRN